MNTNRRRLIQAIGIGLSVGLAGCSGSGTGGDGEADTAESTPTDTETMDTDEEMTSTSTDESSMETTTPEEDTGTATATPEEDTATPTATDTSETASLAIDNQGISAWVVPEDSTGVAGDGENPTFTLEVGTRYVIENRARSAHPFALRAADDTPLLSQSADGTFEDDAAVDWVDNDSTLEFTLTEELASETEYYICTVHSSMEGAVETA